MRICQGQQDGQKRHLRSAAMREAGDRAGKEWVLKASGEITEGNPAAPDQGGKPRKGHPGDPDPISNCCKTSSMRKRRVKGNKLPNCPAEISIRARVFR
jgi:hypothetical protein